MAESAVKVYGKYSGSTINAVSYTEKTDIPTGNMVAITHENNLSKPYYCQVGDYNDKLATNFKLARGTSKYAILKKVKKITVQNGGVYKPTMSIAQDGEGFYRSSWAGSNGALAVANSPDFLDVTFPCSGNYKINFQADEIYEAHTGYGAYLYFKEGLDSRTIQEAGYVYCYYGLRLAALNGTVLRWIGLPNNLPTRQYVSDTYSFTITDAWFNSYGPTFRIGCFLMSSNGDYWRLHGTRVTNARIYLDFA